jgi:hypothetical protein
MNFAFTILDGSAPVPKYIGANTATGDGGIDVGATGRTIKAGNGAGHWQLTDSGGRCVISPSATGSAATMSGSPYTLTISDGTRYTITTIANAASVETSAKMKTKLEAGVAYGFQILLRTGGTYNTGADGVTPVISGGTWTAPTDSDTSTNTAYTKGLNLDSGTFIRIRPHPGEAVTVTDRWKFNGSGGVGQGRIRLTGITFNITDAGSVSALSATGMYQPQGADYMAVDGCTFQALSSTGYTEFERRVGIYAPAASGFDCTQLIVQDCGFFDCWMGIVGSNGTDCCIIGNEIKAGWNDYIKLTPGNRMRICWNFMHDKKRPTGGAHPDFIQMTGLNVATDVTNSWIVGNVMVRGSGVPGLLDGQPIFFDDLGTSAASTNVWATPLVLGNRIVASYVNCIYFGGYTGRTNVGTTNAYILGNTVLNDNTVVSNNVLVTASGGSITATGTTQGYNLLAASSVTGTDIMVTRYTGYPTYIAGGTGIMDSGIGTTFAQVLAATNVVAGSAADTASPKVGAHQDYFDYVNRTVSVPYSLPTHP